MKLAVNWKVGALVAVGAGLAYAVYRAEQEKKIQEAPSGLTLRALPSGGLQFAPEGMKKTLLGDFTPTQATGAAMVGGFVLYAAGDLAWDLLKSKIVSAA